jgi:hypothetical protein
MVAKITNARITMAVDVIVMKTTKAGWEQQ